MIKKSKVKRRVQEGKRKEEIREKRIETMKDENKGKRLRKRMGN